MSALASLIIMSLALLFAAAGGALHEEGKQSSASGAGLVAGCLGMLALLLAWF